MVNRLWWIGDVECVMVNMWWCRPSCEKERGSHGLSARRARRTKSRGPKGPQLEVGARRAPRLLVIYMYLGRWIAMNCAVNFDLDCSIWCRSPLLVHCYFGGGWKDDYLMFSYNRLRIFINMAMTSWKKTSLALVSPWQLKLWFSLMDCDHLMRTVVI